MWHRLLVKVVVLEIMIGYTRKQYCASQLNDSLYSPNALGAIGANRWAARGVIQGSHRGATEFVYPTTVLGGFGNRSCYDSDAHLRCERRGNTRAWCHSVVERF